MADRTSLANRLRFIGSGVLVLGVTGAYLFYRVRSQSMAPTMDELLPGYSERRARQTAILMGGFVVSLLQGMLKGDAWSAHVTDLAALAIVFAACTALSAKVFRWE